MNLLTNGDEKNDAFSRILAFYEPDSEIVLSAEEDKILSRWCHCDGLIRSRKLKTAEIIDQLKEKFGVSKFTAEKDIAFTNALFGKIRTISKSYGIGNAIENIQIQIAKFENDKSLVHLLPNMYRTLERFYALLPDEIAKRKVEIPNVYIGSLTVNNGSGNDRPTVINIDEARKKWKERKEKKSNDDYIDHEDVK